MQIYLHFDLLRIAFPKTYSQFKQEVIVASLKLMSRKLKLSLILYPVVTAAVTLNLFMLNLILIRIGFQKFPPIYAVWIGIPLSIPVTYYVVKWIAGLMAEAEK